MKKTGLSMWASALALGVAGAVVAWAANQPGPEKKARPDSPPQREKPGMTRMEMQRYGLLPPDSQSARIEREARRSQPPPEELRRKIAAMRERMADLARAGKREEAARVRRDLDALRRRVGGLERRRGVPERLRAARPEPPRPPEGPPPEEIERRLHHIEVAVDNLHAAGLHDVAEELARRAGEMRADLERRRAPEPRPEGLPPEAMRGIEERFRAIGGAVAELREEMGRLARQVRELRGWAAREKEEQEHRARAREEREERDKPGRIERERDRREERD